MQRCDHYNATKSGNRHINSYIDVLATCVHAKADPDGVENVEFCTMAASTGLHIELSQHLLFVLLIN